MKKPKKQKPKAKQRARQPDAQRSPTHTRRGSSRASGSALARARPRAWSFMPAGLSRELAPLVAVKSRAVNAAGKAAAGLGLMARRAPAEFGPAVARLRARASAVSLPYSADEREVIALLFLPFLLLASAIVISQSVRNLSGYPGSIAVAPDAAPLSPQELQRRTIAALPVTSLKPRAAPSVMSSVPSAGAMPSLREEGVSLAPSTVASETASEVATPAPLVAGGADAALLAAAPLPGATGLSTVDAPQAALPSARDLDALAAVRGSAEISPSMVGTKLASLGPEASISGLPLTQRALPPLTAPEITTLEVDGEGQPVRMCRAPEKPAASATQLASLADLGTLSPGEFGQRLAAAAREQVEGFVVYNPEYSTISYPMGDVPAMFGVCTDVVVRAYRAVGIDLQALVHQARIGTGDTSIDHRRVEVLKKFFAKEGASVPITTFPEDYLPGDVVTYYRPQNQHTTTHIAIISSVIAPSGRPMIIHNRGWGPQMEDALFVDEITGHFRYMGRAAKPAPATPGVVDGARGPGKPSSPGGRAARRGLTPAAYQTPAGPAKKLASGN